MLGHKDENDSEAESPGESHRCPSIANWEDPATLPFNVESRKSTAKPKARLSYTQAAFFATVIEDFLTSIRIVGECQCTIRRIKATIDMDKLMAKKFSVADSPFQHDDLVGLTKDNIGCEDFKLKKIVGDRENIERVATEIYTELTVDRSYFKLIKANTELEKALQRYSLIKEEEMKNRAIRRKLRRQLRVQHNINATNEESFSANIDRLREQLEDVHLISNIKGIFLNRWQNSLTEQQEESIRQEENGVAEKILKYKVKQEEEARVHGEMELVTAILVNEMLAEIQHLMTKYERDTEAMELKIQKKKNQYDEMEKKRINLENQLAHKKDQILRWHKFVDDRRCRQEYEKKMHEAALVIQAWWRGFLVRHQLGPFRYKKGQKTNRGKKSATE